MTQKSLSDDFIEVMAAIRAVMPQDNSDPYRSMKRSASDAALRAIANGISTAWGVLGVLDAYEYSKQRDEKRRVADSASGGRST